MKIAALMLLAIMTLAGCENYRAPEASCFGESGDFIPLGTPSDV